MLISTGLTLTLPEGFCARIIGRSSLAREYVDAFQGLIDENFRGEIRVLLINRGSEDYPIAKGDRVAQLLFHKIERPTVIESPLHPSYAIRNEE